MTVGSVEAVQVRVTWSWDGETRRLWGLAGGLVPVAAAVVVTDWFCAAAGRATTAMASSATAAPIRTRRLAAPGGFVGAGPIGLREEWDRGDHDLDITGLRLSCRARVGVTATITWPEYYSIWKIYSTQ